MPCNHLYLTQVLTLFFSSFYSVLLHCMYSKAMLTLQTIVSAEALPVHRLYTVLLGLYSYQKVEISRVHETLLTLYSVL